MTGLHYIKNRILKLPDDIAYKVALFGEQLILFVCHNISSRMLPMLVIKCNLCWAIFCLFTSTAYNVPTVKYPITSRWTLLWLLLWVTNSSWKPTKHHKETKSIKRFWYYNACSRRNQMVDSWNSMKQKIGTPHGNAYKWFESQIPEHIVSDFPLVLSLLWINCNSKIWSNIWSNRIAASRIGESLYDWFTLTFNTGHVLHLLQLKLTTVTIR